MRSADPFEVLLFSVLFLALLALFEANVHSSFSAFDLLDSQFLPLILLLKIVAPLLVLHQLIDSLFPAHVGFTQSIMEWFGLVELLSILSSLLVRVHILLSRPRGRVPQLIADYIP